MTPNSINETGGSLNLTVVVQNAPFKASAYVEVDAGSYQFDVSPAGAAENSASSTRPQRTRSGLRSNSCPTTGASSPPRPSLP